MGLKMWQERQGSNPRPSVLETDALPTELRSCEMFWPSIWLSQLYQVTNI